MVLNASFNRSDYRKSGSSDFLFPHVGQCGQADSADPFGATEAERKRLAPVVAAWYRILALNRDAHYFAERREQIPAGQRSDDYHQLYPAAFAAALACGSFADAKAVRDTWGLEEELATILGDRRPAWLEEYCEFRCGQQFGWAQHAWRQVRALVRAGLCSPPEHDNYVLGVFEGIRPMFHHRDNQRRAAQGLPLLPEPTIKELLLGPERDWLESTFWRVFEVEGNGRTGFASDANRGGGWTQALLEKHGDKRDPGLRARLGELSGAVRASLGQHLKAWIDAPSPPENPAPVRSEAPGTIASSANEPKRIVPPTDSSRAIPPIASLEELLDRAAAMLESPEDTDAVERVLDGLCRLCDRRPADFERRAAPLAKRALTFVTRFHRGPNYNPAMEQALASLVLSWLAATDVLPHAEYFTLGNTNQTSFCFAGLARLRRR